MVMDATESSVRENLLLELRRGAIVLAVLAQLRDEEYGYSLKKLLAEKGLEVDEGTLYPLLRRLEAQGLIEAIETDDRRRPYRLTAAGAVALKAHLDAQRRVADVGLRRLAGNWGTA